MAPQKFLELEKELDEEIAKKEEVENKVIGGLC